MLNPGLASFALIIRKLSGNAWAGNATVNPLIAIDLTGVGGVSPFYVAFDDCNINAHTSPMFVLPIGRRGRVSCRNILGERLPLSISTSDVTLEGFSETPFFLTENCNLDSVSGIGFLSDPPNAFVDGSTLLTQRSWNAGSSYHFTPVGSARIINASYPSGSTNISKISGIPFGATRNITFNGNITLQHGASLVLAGGVNVTPANGDTMTFLGRGINGATEIWRSF